MTGELPLPESDPALRRLAPLAGVSRYPERVKCATLAWHAREPRWLKLLRRLRRATRARTSRPPAVSHDDPCEPRKIAR